jgi:di/tricarboxylate transporter
VLVSLAIVIAVAHLFEHSGSLVLMSQGLEDLLIGFPTAALLAIIGLVRLGT